MATGAADDFTFLAEAARRSIEDLRAATTATPSDGGRRGAHFRDVVVTYLDALDAAIVARETDFAAAQDASDKQSVIREMRLINHAVIALHPVSPWIESAGHRTVGLGLVYFIDEIVQDLLKRAADVVITPDPVYMYRTVYKPLERELKDQGVTYPVTTAPVVVAYPAQEPDSLFLHLIVAHEIGHSASAEHGMPAAVWGHDPDAAGTQKIVGRAVGEYMAVEQALQQWAVGKVRAIIGSWLTECVCDMLALGFLGPSFLVTMAAFSTPFGGPEPSDTHPPFTLRTKLLIECIDAWGWRQLLEQEVPKTFAWIETNAALPQATAGRTYFDRIFDVIDRNGGTIRGVVEAHLSGTRFRPEEYTVAAAPLATLLDAAILPAQLPDRSSAGRRSILLAGMFAGFRKYGDDPASIPLIVADAEYQRFLTKGLEMSAVLERWSHL